jgi:hypothetical protein
MQAQTDFEKWLPVLINIIVAAFIYGGLFVQVKNSKEDIEAVQADDKEQWKTIGVHGERIASLEGGVPQKFNGAAR